MKALTKANVQTVIEKLKQSGKRPHGVYYYGQCKEEIARQFLRCEKKQPLPQIGLFEIYSFIGVAMGTLKKFREETEEFDEMKIFFYDALSNRPRLEEVEVEDFLFE